MLFLSECVETYRIERMKFAFENISLILFLHKIKLLNWYENVKIIDKNQGNNIINRVFKIICPLKIIKDNLQAQCFSIKHNFIYCTMK